MKVDGCELRRLRCKEEQREMLLVSTFVSFGWLVVLGGESGLILCYLPSLAGPDGRAVECRWTSINKSGLEAAWM